MPVFESQPFILDETCRINYLIPDFKQLISVQTELYTRYGAVGDHISYDLYYYDQDWKYLQTAVSKDGLLDLKNIPDHALLMLQLTGSSLNHDIRPFVVINGKTVIK